MFETAHDEVHVLIEVAEASSRLTGQTHVLLILKVARSRLQVKSGVIVIHNLE